MTRVNVPSSRWQQLVLGLLALIVLVGAVAAISAFIETSGEVKMINDGVEINVSGDRDQNWETPYRDSDTVYVETANKGNMSFSSPGTVTANVSADVLEGTFTNVTDIDTGGDELRLNPDDKPPVRVDSAAAFNYTDYQADDGNVDFTVDSSSSTDVNLTGFQADDDLIAINDDTGAIIDGNVADSTGEINLTIPSGQTDVRLEKGGGPPQLSNPTPQGRTDGFPSTLEINVSDDGFSTDEVTVDFEVDGNPEGSATVSSDGVASTSFNADMAAYSVTATATDATGQTTIETWTFETPQNLTIREARNPNAIIDDRRVNATFFRDGNITEKSTTNGNISMDGLPIEDNIVVTLDAEAGTSPSDYFSNENLVVDFTEQQDAYLLNSAVASQTVRFTLTDRTGGEFENNKPTVGVQKPLDHGGALPSTQYRTIYADRFGPKGATAELEDGQRYRIIVRNDDNDVRSLGSYEADASETVELEVGQIGVGPQTDGASVSHNFTYDDSGASTYIRVRYNDTATETEQIRLRIYEFNNESNVLVTNQTFRDGYGTFAYNRKLTAAEENKTWTVELRGERPGDNYAVTSPVGESANVLPGMPERLKILISMGTIVIVAGLFSQINGHFGALAVAGLGGIFWFVGFLPDGVDIGIVVLAMVVAGLIFVREREATA